MFRENLITGIVRGLRFCTILAVQQARPTLFARRQRLRRLVQDLQAELAELEGQLQSDSVPRVQKLSRDFFWRVVAPLLVHSPVLGATNQAIQAALSSKGIRVHGPAFRLFLNRAKRNGWIELVPHLKGRGGWRLTPAGLQRLRESQTTAVR